jgi:hypothetical protein
LDFEDLIQQTAQDLLEGTAVIFLGAGASMGNDEERASGKGVPSAGEMTEAIAKRFGVPPKYDADGNLSSSLSGIASRVDKKRGESTAVKKFVVSHIQLQCGAPLKAHRALAQVAPKIVMTTDSWSPSTSRLVTPPKEPLSFREDLF